MSLQTRVTGILTKPADEWPAIAAESIDPVGLMRDYAAPLAAIPAVCRFIGMSVVGISVPLLGTIRTGIVRGAAGAIVSWVFALAGAWLAAMVVEKLAPTFQSRGSMVHALKLVERRDAAAFSITQTHARHILLRPSPQLSQEAAIRRLAEMKRQIVSRSKIFEDLARENSEDGSASAGGDLGWAAPGQFVPEFEDAMNALAIGGVSDPIVSRFGVHLIQVIERREVEQSAKEVRDQARAALREQKFGEAYQEWAKDLRARAYIEMREPPQQ